MFISLYMSGFIIELCESDFVFAHNFQTAEKTQKEIIIHNIEYKNIENRSQE